MPERPYHHGNLRNALIEAGLELLAERDVEALSLREVARKVGVSAPSSYRHFANKDALLLALAEEGLDRLATVQIEASAAAGGGSEGFAATGRAYIDFALRNPALYRLIFNSSAGARGNREGRAMHLLLENAAAAKVRECFDEPFEIRALRSWAQVHGLVMLVLDGLVPIEDDVIDLFISSTQTIATVPADLTTCDDTRNSTRA